MQLPQIFDRNGRKAVSAYELYISLGFNPAHWAKWYKKNIISNPLFLESKDWAVLTPSVSTPKGGHTAQDFALTIDLAKRFSMMAKTEIGEQIRTYFIQCEQTVKKPMTQAELLLQQAQLMVEQDRRITKVEEKILEIDARTSTKLDHFTILGYARLNNIQITLTKAGLLGKKAKKICLDRKIDFDTMHDPRWGFVGVYPIEVCKEVFQLYFN